MNPVLTQAEEKMTKSVNALANEYSSIRAGRANPAVLDKVLVEYYGAPTPVTQLAAVSVPEARTLLIQPWDKSALKGIEKAIQTSDIGINPQNDGSAADRGTPPRSGQGRVQIRGRGEDRGALDPPRRYG